MGKSFLVVGASSGIGASCVRELADEKTTLVIVARSTDKLMQLKEECQGNIIVYPYDLNDLYNIKMIFNVCKEEQIKFDGMIYCAGVDGIWPIKANNTVAMQQMMNVNCFAFVELARHFYSTRISKEGAAIVAISSIASLLSDVGMSSYSASKAALNSYVKTMSKEFLRRKIRVNAILPAGVSTKMSSEKGELLHGIKKEDNSDLASFGMIPPENIAKNVRHLLSEDASYVTGELITISAGMNY